MCMNKSSEQPGELFWTQFLTGLRVSGKGRALLLPSNLSTSSGRSLCMPSTRLSMSAEPQTTICSRGGYIWLMERATQTPGSPVAMYRQFLRPLSERRPRLRSWCYLPRTVPIQRSSSARSSIPAGWLCLQVTAAAAASASSPAAVAACYYWPGQRHGDDSDHHDSESALSVRYEPGDIMMMHTKPDGSLQVHAAAGRAGFLVRSRSTKFDSDVYFTCAPERAAALRCK